MATRSEPGQENQFAQFIVPWLVAAGALLLYLLTLNPWISVSGLTYIARATGQVWLPELTGPYSGLGPFGPLLYLVTYPARLLPEKWIPLALNLFSAVCAAATLGLLARSVALLPHNRTHEQRRRERGAFALLSLRTAWIPPVFAAAVCGLQFSFWEDATAACDDIFRVLLFAYEVRCLLEYRIDQRQSWILRAAVVHGAAMTGNWMMIGLFPAFIASLVWIRGRRFFNLRFLRGVALCCLAGMLFYLLLPLIYVLSRNAEFSFWEALKLNVLSQLEMLQIYFLRIPRYIQLLLMTTSLLPVVLIGIRWASYFGDPSKVGIAVTTGILHVAHSALLGTCIWVAFDPVFSPRQKGIVIPELYYLGALSVGYFTGYFLLVFRPVLDRMGRASAWQFALNRVAQAVLWGLLFLVPLGLIWKNLPQIRITNGPAMKQYASLLTQNLPADAVIFCDSQSRGDAPLKLWLAKAWLARSDKARNPILTDAAGLQAPAYHAVQRKRYGSRWPPLNVPKNAKRIPGMAQLQLATKLAEQFPFYYLNPTFGYYLELFYQQPHGLVFEMKRYPTNSVGRPPLTAAEIAENEKFWQTNQPALEVLLPWIKQKSPSNPLSRFRSRWMKALRIPFEPNLTASTLGRFYAQSVQFWAVELQKSGRWGEATRYFELALALSPANVAAKASAECNQELRAHRRLKVPALQSIQDEFGKYRDWEMLFRDNGLFDDPLHCLIQGMAFAGGRLYRQAAQQFERVHEFDPNYMPATLWLARFYANQIPEKTLTLLSQMPTEPNAFEQYGIRKRDVSMTEAIALFASRKVPEAEQVMQQAMKDNPNDEMLLSMVVQVSAMFGRLSNALSAVKRELEIVPTNATALLLEGYLQLQNGSYNEAIPPLTRALSLETNNTTARFNRAIAYLLSDQLDQAQQDYQALEKVFPTSFRVYYGLGEIAWKRNDTNSAIRYYRLYLTNAVPESEEAKLIGDRLRSLTARSP